MTSYFVFISGVLATLYWLISWTYVDTLILMKLTNYIGLVTLLLGAIAVIRVSQIYVYLYLFFSNITTGVPRLIGNLFTFVFSSFIFALIGANVFDLNIATVATTSAVFSLVLGLAMQDTLGNFFSGLALQIDKPFQINDWIEIQNGSQKWLGQIHEINWRATFLVTFSDEVIMFPNRTIAQSQITILNQAHKPIRLNQMLRFPFDTDIGMAKEAMLSVFKDRVEVMLNPGPTCLVTETTESWITIKVFYSIYDYGMRYRISDKIIQSILIEVKKRNLKLAHQTISINGDGKL